MAQVTNISWADATWNVLTGCTICSPGCQRCYAMRLAGTRLKHHPSREGLTIPGKNGPVWTGEVRFNRQWLYQPIHWKTPTAIFVCAHSDLFHEDVPDEWIDEIFAVMARCPKHLFMVLTKRIKRAREYVISRSATAGLIDRRIADYIVAGQGEGWPKWPLPNLWLGTSVEDQPHADLRMPDLLATPAALHWVSVEPMLGPIQMRPGWLPRPGLFSGRNNLGLQLVIAGGESQAGARWLPSETARSIRDQVVPSGAVFHFKQWGAWLPADQVTTGEQRAAIERAHKRKWLAGVGPGEVSAYQVGPGLAGHLLDGVAYRDMPAWPASA